MGEVAQKKDAQEPRGQTANRRFRDGWSTRLGWSTVVAVVMHAAVFAFWPGWERNDLTSRDTSDPLEILQLRWSSLYEIPIPSSPRDTRAAAAPVSPEADSVADDVEEPPEAGELDADEVEALRDRLRRASPMASITEREPDEPQIEEPPVEEEDSTVIAGDASTSEMEEALESGSVDLDRLSAIRPELALVGPSAWVLIRNPTEVEAFMRRSYRRGDVDEDTNGSVSVALWIDERGSVEWAEISESSGNPELDEVALALFSEVASFRPARDEGVPRSRSVIFSVQFPWF